jgi:hypothetical protein
MESLVILSYMTSSKIGDGTWNGTTKSFIVHWQNQVHLYEKHVPSTDHFSVGQKRIMLQVAVHGINKLQQVKNTAGLMGAASGTTLTYNEYTSLLMAAASAYDEQIKAKKAKRHVMVHELYDEDPCVDDVEHPDLDLFLTLIVLLAHYRHMQPTSNLACQAVLTPRRSGCLLSDTSKALWDCLDEKYKAVILGYSSPTPSLTSGPLSCPPFSCSPPPRSFPAKAAPTGSSFKLQANLHEISAYVFLMANMHALETDASPCQELDMEDVDSTPPDKSIGTCLINVAKSSVKPLPPGDIQRVMSKSSICHVSFAHLEYRVTFHDYLTVTSLSFIDRGTNGGVAGEDVHMIFHTPRTINHINDIDIGTVGGAGHPNVDMSLQLCISTPYLVS